MKRKVYIAATLVLCGCQAQSFTYTRIGMGPSLEYAQAQCKILAPMTNRGVTAVGTPGFVIGSHLGNAINNSVREDQFIEQCMILQGWKRITVN
ncbi:hypothetical protein [Notoacmeibacter sp. MSK16QG-6]|uniref:hypothetical protein n=1 Tax=Notoacmeibacter sp. MSK16QG-6 TaxID=2957982 RepID=UPI00209FB646|nr:hypothetical protein [Notoacmeibacter sp. MSK16QG-6]MCP1200051.1 hypothetical protein [Notoacmeibacter sp. MSK16QG-6]